MPKSRKSMKRQNAKRHNPWAAKVKSCVTYMPVQLSNGMMDTRAVFPKYTSLGNSRLFGNWR